MNFGRPRVADFPTICHQCQCCFSSLLSWGWGWDNILSFPVFLLLPLCYVQWFQRFCRMWVIFPYPSSPETSDNTRGKKNNSPFPLPCKHFFSEEATSDAAGKSVLAKKMSMWDSCTFVPVESWNLHIELTKCCLDWELDLLMLTGPLLFEMFYDWTSKAPLLILFHLLAGTVWISDSKHGWRRDPYMFFWVDELGAEGIFSGKMPRWYLCSFCWVEYAARWEIFHWD